jgi:NADH-quinone oxidoreductase subunit G
MPDFFIDGRPVRAESGQTVLQAALASGVEIPYFCYHPSLSIAGSCRVCVVQVEGRSWVEIACNMPVTEGLRVLTDSELVREHRKAMLQLTLLNHPVDCGICDKAGECTLQDYHYEHNGERSVSVDPKVRATKFHALSERILLDNERCILCSRCVRFTREVSKSNALGIQQRGDGSLVRASEDGAFGRDPYSDNVIDICPVGALLSRSFLYKSRVWYLEPTPSICPGCARGCAVNVWHRKAEWKLNALDPRHNTAIERVTPRENPAVNGPWICNKARDLATIFERPRALQPMRRGAPVDLGAAIDAAASLVAQAKRRIAIVSSWGSNEELAAFAKSLGGLFASFVKPDQLPVPGEVVEDGFLIRADKNPNRAAALALFPPLAPPPATLDGAADLVLVWGEGFDIARVPAGARTILLDAYAQPGHARADVFIPLSIQTERSGHYTNCDGVVSAFERCFAKPASVADAATLFEAIAAQVREPA